MCQGEEKTKQKETAAEKKRFGALPCCSPGCSDDSCRAPAAGLAAEAQAAGSRVMSPGVGHDSAHSGKSRITIAARNTHTYVHTTHSSNSNSHSNSNSSVPPEGAVEACIKVLELEEGVAG